VTCNITQQLTEKQTDPLNSTHENLSATLQARCKQYIQ